MCICQRKLFFFNLYKRYQYKLLKHINSSFHNSHLIVGDFDMLRTSDSALQGIHAPIVSRKMRESHEKKDYKDYLVERGEADIFFPTNFNLLQKMYKNISGKKS
jgi:hypothetical protein